MGSDLKMSWIEMRPPGRWVSACGGNGGWDCRASVRLTGSRVGARNGLLRPQHLADIGHNWSARLRVLSHESIIGVCSRKLPPCLALQVDYYRWPNTFIP